MSEWRDSKSFDSNFLSLKQGDNKVGILNEGVEKTNTYGNQVVEFNVRDVEGKDKLWQAPKSVVHQLKDIPAPLAGRFITINKTGQGLKTRYIITLIEEESNSSSAEA